jgi:hypothetical protein
MKERRVSKKGRVVVTRRGEVVINLANKIVQVIRPYCKKIQFVGSIRRERKIHTGRREKSNIQNSRS